MSTNMPDLSLEQKASLLSGANFWQTKELPDAGIPAVVLTDGPHGIRRQLAGEDHLGLHHSEPSTCFPPAVAVGSSWNPVVARKLGAGVGKEGRRLGVSVALGPGVNIKRSPLCGRNFEYYSEDPLLSGILGAAHVTGLQTEGVGASVKHFAANNQETERMRVSVEVDERTLREIYLPAFERIVKEARPATVMCSYNKINGVYASENRWLLTELLRDEWGFEGAVVSDWGAVSNRVAALKAGLDLDMPGNGGTSDREIVEAVKNGTLDIEDVDRAVSRVLSLTHNSVASQGHNDVEDSHHLAHELARECIVLLKNDGPALPLAANSRIAVIGHFAAEPRYQGGGSSHINATREESALESIREHAARLGAEVTYSPGFTASDLAPEQAALMGAAVEAAGASDMAIVFAGLSEQDESEGFDRSHLDLPAHQVRAIRAVAQAAPKTVVVLSHGGVVSLEGWHDDVDAIVEGWLLGQAGGAAIADVLFGVVNPSGHLAETIPLRLQDNPSWLNFPGEQQHVRYGEGVFVGYRYYTSAEVPVRYHFGHGLSYTKFRTDGLDVEVTGPSTACARVTVTNTGSLAGRHVIQLYVATTAGPVKRPARELRAFTKIDLGPGQTSTVELKLDHRSFAYYDQPLGRWLVAPGDYAIQIGVNAGTVETETTVSLVGDTIARELSMDSPVGEWFGHPVVGPVLLKGITASMSEEQALSAAANQDSMRMVESLPMKQFVGFLGGALPPEALDQLLELSRQPAEAV
ncbi:glycoside hydrolase family 3 C-terminal domain-containing protein [Arthrobacter sp. 135MFCol5.1]|uniref:glycoside hydrolase family 3 C-terminal domain-containing protein n=1 Tax=Arthrobacter sp. 135MFCol5.1 TaxID=1158050 RepID=UPI0003641D7A|nr:glycoside hydrolase family 3 C-terminal domain-containing protein [Arthrobacter sp. 135MFCol5.1]